MGFVPSRPTPDLREAIRRKGFTPPLAAAGAVIDLVCDPDEAVGEAAERALARMGSAAARGIEARLGSAVPPCRAKLCRALGRVAREADDEGALAALVSLVDDRDLATRRQAIVALGKIGGDAATLALAGRLPREDRIEVVRALVEALGKVGGARAREALANVAPKGDAELARVLDRARLRTARTETRREPSSIDATRTFERPVTVRFHCRRGLEHLLAAALDRRHRPTVGGHGLVLAEASTSMAALFQARLALRFGFPLAPEPISGDASDALARALVSPAALAILRTFTRGAIRYRIEWPEAGHRRAATLRAALTVGRTHPELVNDPTESTWEVLAIERGDTLEVELWPRGLEDPRFGYRVGDVYAASHPTIAAALAFVGGAREGDVVWDPFVGSGLELAERARLGPFAKLVGTDVDPRALAVARANLESAGVRGFELVQADARSFRPAPPPTLVVTNPPMGRRLVHRRELGALYRAVIRNVATALVPGGRFVWMSPVGDATVQLAERTRLRTRERTLVDMGGFDAELQAFEKR